MKKLFLKIIVRNKDAKSSNNWQISKKLISPVINSLTASLFRKVNKIKNPKIYIFKNFLEKRLIENNTIESYPKYGTTFIKDSIVPNEPKYVFSQVDSYHYL